MTKEGIGGEMAIVIASGAADTCHDALKAFFGKNHIKTLDLLCDESSDSKAIADEVRELSGRDTGVVLFSRLSVQRCLTALAQMKPSLVVWSFYSSPSTWLASSIQNNLLSSSQLSTAREVWKKDLQTNMELLRHHPSQMRLCDLADALAHPHEFIRAAGLALGAASSDEVNPFCQPRGIENLLADLALVDQDALYSLYDEARLAGCLFGEFTIHLSPSLGSIIEKAKDLYARLSAQAQYANDELTAQLSKLQEQLEQTLQCPQEVQNELTAEVELASLQISQLQEELEHYYLAYQASLEKQRISSGYPLAGIVENAFLLAQAQTMTVFGQFESEGYRDLHLQIDGLNLANGQRIEQLRFKLVDNCGSLGLEFRDIDAGDTFTWHDDLQDDHGRYLRITPRPLKILEDSVALTLSRMPASEKLLCYSLPALVARLFQQTKVSSNIEMTDEQWRYWRMAALTLADQGAHQTKWLSFDKVTLIEEYLSESYEHLWIRFTNLLIGDTLRPLYEMKIAATGLNDREDCFAEIMQLEFRQQADGIAPLQAWPIGEEDKHGHKLVVQYRQNGLPDLGGVEVSAKDAEFLHHLGLNIPSVIEKLSSEAGVMTRDKNEWRRTAEALIVRAEVAQTQLKQAGFLGRYSRSLFQRVCRLPRRVLRRLKRKHS